jgi:ATP:ADP antiporter, AAA family
LTTNERKRVLLAALAFFLLLCAYYILRPVRDAMGAQNGAAKLPWLFTATFLGTLIIVPVFGWVVQRVPRERLVPVVYGFLVLNLLVFLILGAGGISLALAGSFFVWLSVANLFAIALFWSNTSDCFSTEESHRLYGYIAAGGTIGALAGPALTALLARQVSTSALMAMSALLLVGAAIAMMALRRARPPELQSVAKPIGGSILAGIFLTLKTPSLRGLALLVVCYTTISTVLYLDWVDVVKGIYPDTGDRTALFASFDLTVNCVALGLQVLGTRQIVLRYGLRTALTLGSLLVLAGLLMLSAMNSFVLLAVVQLIHRASDYSLMRPGREMIYTTVDPESRYKAKNFIDTTVYRANDAASSWLITAVVTAGLSSIYLVAVPAALLLIATGFRLGRRHDQGRLGAA